MWARCICRQVVSVVHCYGSIFLCVGVLLVIGNTPILFAFFLRIDRRKDRLDLHKKIVACEAMGLIWGA